MSDSITDLKVDIINEAFRMLRISGLTIRPSPEDLQSAILRLETMAAELERNRNIRLNYNFEKVPDPNSNSNIDLSNFHAMASNLAVRLVADYNKEIPPQLQAQANQALSTLSAWSAQLQAQETQYPTRQPRGSGNTQRYDRWARFYSGVDQSPQKTATNVIVLGDIDEYNESWQEYVRDVEDISTFTITADSGLRILSSSLDGQIVTYEVEAEGVNEVSNPQIANVKIQVETTEGRKNTRVIPFEIQNLENIGES